MKQTLKIMLVLISVVFFSKCSINNAQSDIYIASWNVENLFDSIDDSDKDDSQFLPSGDKEWTELRLERKLENLAKVINFMNNGRGPDIIGFQEVEHEHLLKEIIEKYLKNKNYKVAYAESPDGRGIDNGLMYNRDKFRLVSTNSIIVELEDKYPTRSILHVELKHDSVDIHIFVNHWPSRRNGLKESEKNRIAAAEKLMQEVNNLRIKNENVNIVILGDFNDMPANISISKVLQAGEIKCGEADLNEYFLYNTALKDFKKGLGSYKYRDHWNMLDQLILSKNVIIGSNFNYICDSFEIIKPEFMITKGGKYDGTPRPTFGGNNYLGGYSDHFPIGAKFNIH